MRPKEKPVMHSIYPPIIDIDHPERARTHQAIDAACREWGMFQIVGHGIDLRLSNALKRQMRAFFSQPTAVKHVISRTAENPWGFFDSELTRHVRDWKQIFDVGPADGEVIVPQWPAGLTAFKPVVREFYDACDALALRLLRVISRNLGMPADFLDANFRPRHTSFLRLNYYPKCASPGVLGVNHHTDSGAITLLMQDEQAGLEVFQGGAWWPVEPRADTLVVNIGDIVQVWSNDRYMAPLHRALANSVEERFSVPFFFNPAYSVEYAPLPSATGPGNPARYRPISWREFRARRAGGDYANHGEYHQISHYAV
jgi:isopenicillin N synthase-like dioxygenase